MTDQHNNQPARTIIWNVSAPVLVSAAFIIVAIFFLVRLWTGQYYEKTITQRRIALISNVSMARNAITPIIQSVHSGRITVEEGRKQAQALLTNMTYSDEAGDNYIFFGTYTGLLLVQPFQPELVNTGQWDLQDVNGKYIVREIVQAARNHPTGSYVTYVYPKPVSGLPEEKLSYIVGVPELDCFLGAGIYLQSVRQDQNTLFNQAMWASLALVMLLLVPVLVSLYQLSTNYRLLEEEMAERKRTEQELRTSEERWQFALEGSGDGVWDWDIANHRVHYSEHYRAMLGFSEAELPDDEQSWISNIHPEDVDALMAARTRHMQHETPAFVAEYRMRCKNGGYKWVLGRGRVMEWDADGNPLRMVGTHTDITERRRTEAEIRTSRMRLTALFNTVGAGLVVVDRYSRFIEVNARWCEMTGYTADELVGKSLMDITHPEDLDASRQALLMLLDGSVRHAQVQKRYLRKNGDLFWGAVSVTPMYGPEQRIEALVGLIIDITERYQAEEALRDSEVRFRLLAENSTDLISRHTLEGAFLYASPACKAIMGYEPEELLGRSAYEFIHPEDQPLVAYALSTILKQNVTYLISYRSRRKEGRYVWLETSSRAVRDANGQVLEIHAATRDISERRQAEEALYVSEQRFRSIVEASPLGMHMYRLEADGRLIFTGANPAAETILGFNHQLVVGQPIELAFPALVNTEVPDQYRRIAREGGVWELEQIDYQDQRVSGAFEVHAFQTTPGNMVAMFYDITRRKQAEHALVVSEARSRAILNAIPDMMFRFNRSGDILEYFTSQIEQLALPPAQFLGKNIRELLPQLTEITLASIQAALETGQVQVYEYDLYHQDALHSYEARMVACSADEVISIVRDITLRKLSEQALQQRILALTQPAGDLSQVRFEDLFNLDEIQVIQDTFANATGVASIITDPQGRPLTRPSNFCRLCAEVIRKTEVGLENCMHSDAELGRASPDGPILRPCLSSGLWDGGTGITVGDHHIANWLIGQVLDEQDEERMLDYATQVGADPAVYRQALAEVRRMPRAQFENVCQALYQIARQLSLLALQNVQQARYITAQQQAEAEIRRLNASLEQRVQERTSQLQQANKELEAFSYSVSHDLRAPLRSMDGFSHALLEDYSDALDERGRDYLKRIRTASQRMGQLIDDLLKLSRVSREQMRIVPVDLAEIAGEILEELKEAHPQRHVTLRMPEHLHVQADANLMRILLSNLLGNAWKFTAHHPTATIELGKRQQGEQTVYYVCDDGAGFEMAYVNKLFGAFQRLHTENEFPGTGIGLAIVQRIVHRHGGQVWAEGAIEQGATFYFTLPTEEVS